ncbi:hypothetical protein ACFFOW_13210, partial [Curtobacterium albidum]|uniref:hypothetical protein n=1 Tax=Curtobacterium citreum TaxID=2036 RepID=UPI0035EA4315
VAAADAVRGRDAGDGDAAGASTDERVADALDDAADRIEHAADVVRDEADTRRDHDADTGGAEAGR